MMFRQLVSTTTTVRKTISVIGYCPRYLSRVAKAGGAGFGTLTYPSSLFKRQQCALPLFVTLASRFLSTSVDAPTTTASTSSSRGGDGGGVFQKIACIGTGAMARAIIEPIIHKNLQPSNQIVVYDVNTTTMEQAASDFGVRTANTLPELVRDADLVLCCVKPQNLTPEFFAELRKGTSNSKHPEDAILLSIIAGKSINVFTDGGFSKIVRSMPNTPAQIGQGMTVWGCTANLTAAERGKIRDVLSACGKSMYVDDEGFIDMSTSISGSGPAYIFMLMESMIDAGVHMGFPRDKAATLVYHTMLGSTLYAMQTGEHPAILRNSVTSPSGTTASAIYELENGRFRTVVKDAMWACYRRSLEMGNHDSNVGPGRHQVINPKIVLQTDSDEDDDDKAKSSHSK